MSCNIKIELIPEEARVKIDNDLHLKIVDEKYNKTKDFCPHQIEDDNIYLPFSFAYSELKFKRTSRNDSMIMNAVFTAELRDEQKVVKAESLAILNKTGSVIISCFCGFGKSITAINICCAIKLKTLIVVNKIVLMTQWQEAINQFCPEATCTKVTTKLKETGLPESDFYIVNAINVPKFGREFFRNIGCCVMDEVHLLMAEQLSNLANYVYPRYLLGLSATPYRTDGYNILLDLYFGKDRVIREMYRKHTVYKINTNFTPKMSYTDGGKVIWSSVLESQAKDEKRNELIIDIIKKHSDRMFLVLVKRVDHGKYLLKRLLEDGEDATSLLGSNQTFNKESRILIGTGQKVGTGFDHSKLDALLFASDFEAYSIQTIGRVFRTKDKEPIIFDLVDNNGILMKHYKTRLEIYKKSGGVIM